MNVSEVINRLGGRELVAQHFKITCKRVEMWERRQTIPGGWHLPLLVWAEGRGIPLTPSDLTQDARLALAEPAEARA